MKNLLLLTILIVSVSYVNVIAQVAINTDNSSADASAMLDVKSTNKGMLVPRMTTAQRIIIASPATGLLVFDTTTTSFWFFDGNNWIQLVGGNVVALADNDNDTKIQVEENPDEDIIRLDIANSEIGNFSKNAAGDLLLRTTTSNVIFGQNAGGVNTGDSNIFIGKDAGRLNTTGRRNTVMGNQAGFSLVDGEFNVYIGTISGIDNASGNRNTGVGDSSCAGNGGSSNVCMGTAAGAFVGGNNNIFIGDSAGAGNSAGNSNVMIGTGAGQSSTGSGNVFIGEFVGNTAGGVNNRLHIDNSNNASPLIYGEFDNNVVTVNGSFTATSTASLSGGIRFPNSFVPDPAYIGNAGNYISFGHGGSSEDFLGYINNNFHFRDSPLGGDTSQPTVNAGAFVTYSSGRWKHNVEGLDNALSIVKQLRGVSYTWNEDQGGKDDFGFIAEEVHEVLPQIATENADGQIGGVAYGKVTPYLVEAIKEQQLIIEQQQIQLDEKDDAMDGLKAELKRLELENVEMDRRLSKIEAKLSQSYNK